MTTVFTCRTRTPEGHPKWDVLASCEMLPGDPLPDARCGEEDELRRPAKDFLDPKQNAKPKVPESQDLPRSQVFLESGSHLVKRALGRKVRASELIQETVWILPCGNQALQGCASTPCCSHSRRRRRVGCCGCRTGRRQPRQLRDLVDSSC